MPAGDAGLLALALAVVAFDLPQYDRYGLGLLEVQTP